MKFFVIFLFLVSCGKDPSQLKLSLKFPASLSKDNQRFQNFLKKYSFLTISIKTNEGFEKDYPFIASQFKDAKISNIEFPKNERDVLNVKAEFREVENIKSAKIIASGKGKLQAKDYSKTKPNELMLPISLHVTLGEL